MLLVKVIPYSIGKAVIMNKDDSYELGLIEGDRIRLCKGKSVCVAEVNITSGMVASGEILIPKELADLIGVVDGDEIEIYPVKKPESVIYIRKKMEGYKLSLDEIRSIINDTVSGSLSNIELTAFILSNFVNGMDFDEIEWMTRAMIETGETITFERGIVVDKHSIGGVPGNKTALLLVPIVASSGLLIPKTASRAITSATGTADTFEVLADVNLTVDEIKEITERVGGVIAWSASANLAPADDRLIEIQYNLQISPIPHFITSIMSRKSAVGAKHVVVDIPVGEYAKVTSLDVGKELAHKFSELGRRFGLNVTSVITNARQPVGRAIGPALEAKEALKTLEERKGSSSLIEKSLGLAGILLEMSGKTSNGYEYAKEIFNSGKAYEKLKEIILAQGGEITKADDVPIGDKVYTLKATKEGAVTHVRNDVIVKIARTAGAPKDKGAGVYLHKKRGEVVKVGDPIITIYAEKEWKLDNAIDVALQEKPVEISGMIFETYPSYI
ncbi:AMP phosphorylase [Archaeoglobus sulfaticallidus]|nr:AMP phosphorylase [Archaeoglobus sulfaticallidus]